MVDRHHRVVAAQQALQQGRIRCDGGAALACAASVTAEQKQAAVPAGMAGEQRTQPANSKTASFLPQRI